MPGVDITRSRDYVEIKTEKKYVGNDDPLSRNYEFRSPIRFWNNLVFRSIQAVFAYILLIQHDLATDATYLLHVDDVLQHPNNCLNWALHQIGDRLNYKVLLAGKGIYYSIIGNLMKRTESEFARRMYGLIADMNGSCDIEFWVVSRKDLVWATGMSAFDLRSLTTPRFPGFNLYGRLLFKLYYQLAAKVFEVPKSLDGLFTCRVFGSCSRRKFLLVIGDSEISRLRSAECGDVVPISGGTYLSIVKEFKARGFKFGDYKVVVVVSGFNVAKRDELSFWERNWSDMRSFLLSFPRDVKIIFNTPIPGFKFREQLLHHDSWILKKLEELNLPNVHCIAWSSVPDNPFLMYGQPNVSLFADDIHVNAEGTHGLWKSWCDIHPDLCLIRRVVTEEPYKQKMDHAMRTALPRISFEFR
jgi:hypothetical protein